MIKWYPVAMANTKMWGVTGQEADHPFRFQGEISWVEVAYKMIISNLKLGAIKNLPEDRTPLFSERDLQHAALSITHQLFSTNGDGKFTYLGDFLDRHGASAQDKQSFLHGMVALRQIVFRFMGDNQ